MKTTITIEASVEEVISFLKETKSMHSIPPTPQGEPIGSWTGKKVEFKDKHNYIQKIKPPYTVESDRGASVVLVGNEESGAYPKELFNLTA